MAKGTKKKVPGATQIQLPNNWVKVGTIRPGDRCTECKGQHVKGMRWMTGNVSACRPCGQRLARTSLAA